MMIITKRNGQIIRDLPSARLTLTNELMDIGIDIEKENQVSIMVMQEKGKKFIVIETLDNNKK